MRSVSEYTMSPVPDPPENVEIEFVEVIELEDGEAKRTELASKLDTMTLNIS